MKNKLLLLGLVLVTLNACKEDDEAPPRATAAFTVQNNGCDAPCVITFVNTSQNANSYSWDFGDGTTSTVEDPTHLYEQAGAYTATLSATGEGGNHSTTRDVNIIPPVFHLKYKVDGSLVEASLITATRNSPQGFLEISSSAPSLSPPYFSFYIKEPAGGFSNSFNLNLNLNSAIADSTIAAYSNDGATIYSSATDVNGIALNVNYLKYEMGGIISGTFSGTLNTTSGPPVQITEGSLKIMFNN